MKQKKNWWSQNTKFEAFFVNQVERHLKHTTRHVKHASWANRRKGSEQTLNFYLFDVYYTIGKHKNKGNESNEVDLEEF